MNHLVFNKNSPFHLYKKTGHLVRTPITVTLQPKERAYYSVAGDYYTTSAQYGLPKQGFIAANTLSNVLQTGYNCLSAYNTPTESKQIWREATGSHDPETVWYQGAYATSAPNNTASLQSCETYIQMSGYKFETPSGLSILEANSVKLKFVNGGAIVCYQSPANQSSNNKCWINYPGGVSDFYMQFGAVYTLGTASQIAQAPSTQYDVAQQTGTPRAARDLWGRNSTSMDGGIPTFTTTITNEISLSGTMLTRVASGLASGIWIVPYFNASITSQTNYRPVFADNNNGYWACVSVWGLTLEVEYV